MINGFPGCGKTMLSPIISSFTRVEIMQYAPLIEQICELWGLDRIDDDVAECMVRMNTDLLIYNSMMGRNANCRPSDLSSIFRHRPLLHLKRMFMKGDEAIPNLIKNEKPILQLTTHMLFPYSKLLFKALRKELIFIEVIRHPLYMIIQHEKNMAKLEDPRVQHIRYKFDGEEYTFFSDGIEELFNSSNTFEKAIYSMEWYFNRFSDDDYNAQLLVIPFEIFVKEPEKYMHTIAELIGSPITKNVEKEMKKQRVPRKLLSDGPSLDIYKRCGWKPPKSSSESEELDIRRELVKRHVNSSALKVLDDMSKKYTKSIQAKGY
jgi:hypothetical protein